MTPSRDFQDELDRILSAAAQRHDRYADVEAGDLHRRVGGYPGKNHRMPVCCGVMKQNMKSGDRIIEEPPSGQGASLIIRFGFPR